MLEEGKENTNEWESKGDEVTRDSKVYKETEDRGPETLFQTVIGAGQGAKTGHQRTGHEKFKIHESFIRKVLEFETSSPLLRKHLDRTQQLKNWF